MNKAQLLACLEKMDAALTQPMQLYIYGSAAFMMLDEPDRISLDVDVAAPYSQAVYPDLVRAAAAAGLPVNPPADFPGDHLEWIQAARLCLPPPFCDDPMLWDNWRNFQADLALWRKESP